MKIAMISDTHNHHRKLSIEECDLLICSGDISHRGELDIILDYAAWANEQPAKHLVLVPGNHELAWEKNQERYKEEILKVCPRMIILIEESVTIEGFNIYGSPITPWFHSWAWNRHRGPQIEYHWKKIPDNTNILVTHGPPYEILDMTYFADGTPKEPVGCWNLTDRIKELKDLKLHIFGHIHADSGEKHVDGVHYVNAAICDEQYSATNPIRIIEL